MKRLPWFEILLIIVTITISLYAAFSDSQNLPQRWFMRDDAYYYFKVAQNISEGHGSTFDGINPTNGYHPLWMLICIPIFSLARFDLILPLRILLLVMSGLATATGILLYRLLGKIFIPFIGALAAIYWVFSLFIFGVVYKSGLETGIGTFSLVLFLYKLYEFEVDFRAKPITRKQLVLLALLAVLTMFSRLDLAFFAGMAGLWMVFRGHSLRNYLPVDIVSIMASVLLSFTIKFGFPDYFDHAITAAIMIGIALIVKLPVAYFTGLHKNLSDESSVNIFSGLALFTLISSALTSAIMLTLAQIMKFDSMPRTIFIMDALFSAVMFGVIRFIYKDLSSSVGNREIRPPHQILHDHWKEWLTEGSIYYGIIFGSLGSYMLWNKLTVGTFLPISGQIKRWWGTFQISFYGKYPHDIPSFFGISSIGDESAFQPVSGILGAWAQKLTFIHANNTVRYMLVLVMFAVVTYLILRTNKTKSTSAIAELGIIPLLCGCFLQIISYQALGYSSEKYWYWIGELIAIVLFISLLAGILIAYIPLLQTNPKLGWSVVAIVGILMVNSFWNTVHQMMPYGHWPADAPNDYFVPLLEQNTEPGSLIGMTGGGTTSYFIKDRVIVNMDGLINSPQYFKTFQNGTASEYLSEIGVSYIFASRYMLSSRPYKGMFDPYLENTGINYGGFELMKFEKP